MRLDRLNKYIKLINADIVLILWYNCIKKFQFVDKTFFLAILSFFDDFLNVFLLFSLSFNKKSSYTFLRVGVLLLKLAEEMRQI